MKKPLFSMVLMAALSTAQAEVAYVTDQFKITMRSGQSPTHKIIRMLPSGYPLEVVSRDKATGYSTVKAKDGTLGYVLTRQLMPILSARDRLEKAEARLTELQEEPGRLSSKLAKLQTTHQQLNAQHTKLEQEKQTLEQELRNLRRTASNAVRIANERNDLRQQVATLTHQTEELKQENRELSNEGAQRWFLIGAGVIVGGIILGLILPNLRIRRRKTSWGSL